MSDLPPGWDWVTVGSVAESLVDGPFGSNLKTEHYQLNGVRVIRLQNIADGQFNDTDKAFISEEHAKSLCRHDARPGDVLIAAMGDVLPRVCLVPRNVAWAIVKADCFRLRPREGVLSQYLAYMLSAPQTRKRASTQIAGVGRPRLNLKKVSGLTIPMPPEQGQGQIVAAIEEQFSRLDVGMMAVKRARANISLLKASALSLVSEGVSSWVPLGDIAEVVGGVTKDTKKQNDHALVEVPYLRVANVQRGFLDLSQVSTIRVPSVTAQKLQLEPGDILFNEGGDRDKLGRGWVWEGQVPGCIHQNHVFRARLLDDSYDPKFISMHGNSFGRAWFDKNGKQTTNLASLSLTTLKSFPIPRISIEEQRNIVLEVDRRLSILSTLEEETHVALRRAASLRASILQSAFSGKMT